MKDCILLRIVWERIDQLVTLKSADNISETSAPTIVCTRRYLVILMTSARGAKHARLHPYEVEGCSLSYTLALGPIRDIPTQYPREIMDSWLLTAWPGYKLRGISASTLHGAH